MLLVFSVIVFCCFLSGAYPVFAEGETDSSIQQTEELSSVAQEGSGSDTDWKQELDSDKQQLQEQRQEISQNAQAAREEEAQLKQQIKAALDSGDTQSAQQLKEELRSVHQANIQEMMQDKKEMQAAKQDLKNDFKEARQEGYLQPRKDRDNNPPGAKGGAGTNWENPPGPQGGAGAGPDRRPRIGNASGTRKSSNAGQARPQGVARGAGGRNRR